MQKPSDRGCGSGLNPAGYRVLASSLNQVLDGSEHYASSASLAVINISTSWIIMTVSIHKRSSFHLYKNLKS